MLGEDSQYLSARCRRLRRLAWGRSFCSPTPSLRLVVSALGLPPVLKEVSRAQGFDQIPPFPVIVFAVGQVLHPGFAPGVPRSKRTPAWIPGRFFWAYLSAAVFISAGFALVIKKQARQAAAGEGIVVLCGRCLFTFPRLLPIRPTLPTASII
jgi:hypothetical protein